MKPQNKNDEEICLISKFDMEYGMADNWSDEVREEFDRKWDEIQKKYSS